MSITTEAQNALQKLAADEQNDRAQAFEAGFMKAAHDLGLDGNEFQTLYAIGLERLSTPAKA